MVIKDDERITDVLGEILKRERLNKSFSRDEIAERAGIGVRHLAAIENEKRMPSAEVLCRLVRAIGFSADLIVYPESTPQKTEDAEEISQLIRLIRICDKRSRKAAKAMLDVLCFSKTTDDQD